MRVPTTTVRFLKSSGGKKALGANFLVFSQTGNTSRITAPMTSIAIMLALFHWLFARGASVSGSRMSDTAALNSSKPNKSRSREKFLNFWKMDCPRIGLPRLNPSFFARLWFMKRLMKSGMKQIGKMIAQIPYPHRHLFGEDKVGVNLAPISGPAQTVQRKGRSKRVEYKARLSKSEVSATKICCST
jgi:hypothetical protein